MRIGLYFIVISLVVAGCVPQHMSYRNKKNYQSYVSSSVEEKSYVSATPTDRELISAFEQAKLEENRETHDIFFEKGWVKPRGESTGLTLRDEESRLRLNDALNSTPLGSEVRWQKGSVSFILTPNSDVYEAYKSGGICRDAHLVMYDELSEESIRALFCKKGIGADWVRL